LVARIDPIALNAAMAATIAMTMMMADAMRLEYSIHAWWLLAGMICPSVHSGHYVHPSPDPVSRTNAPLGRMNQSSTMLTAVSRRNPRAVVSAAHNRRKGPRRGMEFDPSDTPRW
jgi:hypothetical protein